MIKSTGFVIGVAVVATLGLTGTIMYNEYTGLKKKVEELEAKNNTAVVVNDAQSQSGEVKNEQTTAITAAVTATRKLDRDVAGLRKSVEKLKAESKDSLETCNRSLSAAGEVFGECTERYSEVAGKAERLKTDLIAVDKHSDILQGLVSDLTGLEPLK